MQGLCALYENTGRHAEWARLVGQIVSDFVDATTDGPVAGREEQWGLVTEYRVELAIRANDLIGAEQLQLQRIRWDRERAARALRLPDDSLNDRQRNLVQALRVSLLRLGDILVNQDRPDCVALYEEALEMAQRRPDRHDVACATYSLGRAYMHVTGLRDLVRAERWFQLHLAFCDERDRIGRGRALNTLGTLARDRYVAAALAAKPKQEQLRHLDEARQLCLKALDTLPAETVDDLAIVHNNLGEVYRYARDADDALRHYREAVRYAEMSGDSFQAGRCRFNISLALMEAGRLRDSKEYALAALRSFETTAGGRAREEIERTKWLIGEIESRTPLPGTSV